MSMIGDLFCDLDGVLADFLRGFEQATGKNWEDPSYADDAHKWNVMNIICPRFWAKLPILPSARKFWNHVSTYDPYILTTCPPEMPQGAYQKQQWCNQAFDIPLAKVIVVFSRKDKPKYAVTSDGSPNILIDDYIKNIEEWRSAGGIGIHHTSVEDTIKQLNNLKIVVVS